MIAAIALVIYVCVVLILAPIVDFVIERELVKDAPAYYIAVVLWPVGIPIILAHLAGSYIARNLLNSTRR